MTERKGWLYVEVEYTAEYVSFIHLFVCISTIEEYSK